MMKMVLIFISLLWALNLYSYAPPSSYLVTEGITLIDEKARQKNVGIEVEFMGLADAQIVKIIQYYYPNSIMSGSIESDIVFTLPELFHGKNKEIRIKIEGQAYKYVNEPEMYKRQKAIDRKQAPREIVFPPLKFDELKKVNQLILALKQNGAQGTDMGHGVSIQVNVEHETLNQPEAIKNLLSLMRNYYNEQNQSQAQELIKPADFRNEYILNPTSGFMKKLMDPTYSPTARELYDDYLYRQSLEFKGVADAWTMPIKEARRLLLSYSGEAAVVPEVVKMNKIRVSSLLMMSFPNDPLSKRYIDWEWAKPAPLVEFREYNNDFKLEEKVRWSLGAIRGAEQYGVYKHNAHFRKLKRTCQGILLY